MAIAEQERASQIEYGLTSGNQAGHRFHWNDVRKTIEPGAYRDPDRPRLPLTSVDLGHATGGGRVAE